MIPGCHLGNDLGINTRIIYAENNNTKTTQTDHLLEDVIIEKKRDKPEENAPSVYDWFIKRPYVLAGIPTERFDWIFNNAKNSYGSAIFCPEMYKSQNYTWMHAYILPEVTQKEHVDCQVYRETLKTAISIGPVMDVLGRLNSNLLGFGQFTLLITGNDTLNFRLTGFQLIDTTTKQRFPHPELKVSPSDDVTDKLKKLYLLK